MSNNPFANLSMDNLETQGDSLGGGGPLESNAYDSIIKLAYTGESTGGARSITFHFDVDGREVRETIYVTSGVAKGQKEYYERSGKKIPLPGFTVANDLALLSTGHPISAQTFEEKVASLYDFDERKEIPTKVNAITSMMGKPVTIGLLKVTEDKRKKNEQTGQYEPTGETRDLNTIDKVFHSESKKTVSEFTTGAEEAVFYGKWVEKNKGNTVNKATGAAPAGRTGMPGQAAPAAGSAPAAQSKSLFGG